MSPNLAALLYLVAGVLFILALRGLSSPDSSRRGNQFGMIGMTIAVLTTLGIASAGRSRRLGTRHWQHCRRRRHRRRDCAPRADDLDAGAGRGVPLPGRHGRRAGRGRGFLRARGLRHRHRRSHPRAEPDRNVARRRDRRRHLHRLGDRLPEAVGPHERQADHAAGTSHHQPRARCRADLLQSTAFSSRKARWTSGSSSRCRSRSAS